jgi:hypothetical protein
MIGSTSGNVTLDAPAVSGNNTLVLPTGNGTSGQVLTTNGSGGLSWSGMGPAFSATANAGSAVANGVFTKIPFQVKAFDTASCYDNTTNYRFTPNVGGYYQVTARTQWTSYIGSIETMLIIHKNGSEHRRGFGGPIGVYVNALVYLNGSTDFIEIYAYQATGGSLAVTGLGDYGFFNAALVRPA